MQDLLDANHQVGFTYVDLNSRSIVYVSQEMDTGLVEIKIRPIGE